MDIDGVLNCSHSRSKCGGCIGIDNDKVKRLREILDDTGAHIVLCSSWKSEWEKVRKEDQSHVGNYLDKKLWKEKLKVLDKTIDKGSNRGEGIVSWINNHQVDTWIVLVDEIFDDYKQFGIMPHLIKTEFYQLDGGLQSEDLIRAIRMLNERGINNGKQEVMERI